MTFARVVASLYIFIAVLAPSPAWATSPALAASEADQMQRPPSTSMQTPVIMLASSEQR